MRVLKNRGHRVPQILEMIQEGLLVAVPLEDETLGVVAVEVQLVLQSPGVLSAHQVRAFRGETLKLVKLAIMDFESSHTLKFAHCSYLLLLPQDVGYLAAPPRQYDFRAVRLTSGALRGLASSRPEPPVLLAQTSGEVSHGRV